MQYPGITKKDWKLFQEKVPEWQERHMEKLVEKYIRYLKSDRPASEKIWGLEEKLKTDKRSPGVRLCLEKQEMDMDLALLLKKKIIDVSDLEDFSPELVEYILERWNLG